MIGQLLQNEYLRKYYSGGRGRSFLEQVSKAHHDYWSSVQHTILCMSCSPRRFYIQQQKRPRRQFQYGRRGRRFLDPSKIRFQQLDEQRHKMTFASWFCQTFVFSCQVLSEENKKANPNLFFHFLRPNEVLNFVWKSNENESFDLLGLSWTKMVKDAIFFISFSFEIFHSWKHSF